MLARTILQSARLVFFLSLSFSVFARAQVPVAEQNKKSECSEKDVTLTEYINRLKLAAHFQFQVGQIVDGERSAGRNPKVFIIARAGQDLAGVVTLKDSLQGRSLSVQDIFNRVNPNSYLRDSGEVDVSKVHRELKTVYGDKSRQLIYSHIGILFVDHPDKDKLVTYRPDITNEGTLWVEHLLKPCDTLKPSTFISGDSMFFQDDPHDYRAIIMVPEQVIQDRIYDMIINKKIHTRYLAEKYNVAAPYDSLQEQNSNQWVLEVIAASTTAQYMDVKTRAQAQHLLKQGHFTPTKILADSLKFGFATSVFAPGSVNIRDSEHKFARPYGVTEVVTELSVREYMLRNKITSLEKIFEVVLPDNEREKNLEEGELDEEGRPVRKRKSN